MARRTKFCPKCGKETEELYNGLCKDCYLETLQLRKRPRKVEVKRCKVCGYYYVGSQRFSLLEEAVEHVLSKYARQPNVKSVEHEMIGQNKMRIIFTLEGEGLEKKVELVVPFRVKKFTCMYCIMKKTGYHNALLQVIVSREFKKEVKEFVENVIRRYSSDPMAFISGVTEKHWGFEFKIGSKSVAMKVAKELKSEYGAKLKLSRKLVTKKQGRNLYRLTIAARIGEEA